jgi:hypothetical protein
MRLMCYGEPIHIVAGLALWGHRLPAGIALRGSLCENLISLLQCSFRSEADMPKGQQRSNREKKKPKQPQKPLPPALPGRRPG